jgi:hypothetical protein
MKRLTPVWTAIAAAAQQLDVAHPILASLTSIDQALAETDFATRIRFHLEKD